MKQTILFGAIASLMALGSVSAEVDCLKLALTVKQLVTNEQ